jgi:hypothetical protein
VARAIAELGAEPVWFEEFGGRDDDPAAAYLCEVRSCSIYVGILGRAYGKLLPSRLSATHEEYRVAERHGLRISAWVKTGDDWQGDQRSFVQEVRLFHTTGQFTGAENLAQGVRSRLSRIAAEDLSPWVKLGDVIFRAHRIENDGTHVILAAFVHDPVVVATLEGMRSGLFLGGFRESRLTYAGRSTAARIRAVRSVTTAARATGVEIELDLTSNPDPLSMSFSLGSTTYSADDITEINLRKVLFGEPGPRGVISLGRAVTDPLADVDWDSVPEEILRPILRLALAEALVGTGQATRITEVRLSVQHALERELEVAWVGREQPGGHAETRKVAGQVSL